MVDEIKFIDFVLKVDKVRLVLLEEEKKLLVEVEKGNIKINDRFKEVSLVLVSLFLLCMFFLFFLFLRLNINYFYCKYLVRFNDDLYSFFVFIFFYFCVIYYISYYFIILLYIFVEKKMIKDRKVCIFIYIIL